jgi:hypothetical protein
MLYGGETDPSFARYCNCDRFIEKGRFRLRIGELDRVNQFLKILTYVAAGIYLLVDAIFMTFAKPLANWLSKHLPLRRLRRWIRSLPPYPSLALFSVPVIILEPIKPFAAYLAATGQFVSGALTFIVGELLKLVLVERLFALTREKLMRIPAFARLYAWYTRALTWLKATEAWRVLASLAKSARRRFSAMRMGVVHRFSRPIWSRSACRPHKLAPPHR